MTKAKKKKKNFVRRMIVAKAGPDAFKPDGTGSPPPSKSQARRLASQRPAPAALPPLSPPEFNQELFYYWCEGPAWKDFGFARALLAKFSERYRTYVVPGRELWTYASMSKSQTKMMPTEALNFLLREGMLKPLQGP